MAGRLVAGLIRGAFHGDEGVDDIDSGGRVAVGELCGPDRFVEGGGQEDTGAGPVTAGGTRQWGCGDQIAAGQLDARAVEEAIRHSDSDSDDDLTLMTS